MFITSYIWPISARHDMRVGLSELYLHLGWFFRTHKDTPTVGEIKHANANGGTDRLDEAESSPINRIRPFVNVEQELALQGLLIHLTGLLKAAANEPRLKVITQKSLISGSLPHRFISRVIIKRTRHHRHVIPLPSNISRRSPIKNRHSDSPAPNRHKPPRHLRQNISLFLPYSLQLD
jgi:hypothetical protein